MLRLWKLASGSTEALLLGNMEGCSFLRAFEREKTLI
jgi:hypothetical protein